MDVAASWRAPMNDVWAAGMNGVGDTAMDSDVAAETGDERRRRLRHGGFAFSWRFGDKTRET
jgi:hypothetical protein